MFFVNNIWVTNVLSVPDEDGFENSDLCIKYISH